MEAGNFYHVYNRSVNREALFKETRNYYFFLDRYKRYCQKHVNTFSYCLMPNHFHLFIQVKEETNPHQLAKAFKNLFISYAKAINKGYNRNGSLFQNNYKKKEIDSDSYFSQIIAYLHFNPVRAKIVKRPSDWTFSSFNNILNDDSSFISRNEVLEWFGGVKHFESFHHSFEEEENLQHLLYK